MSEAKEHTPTPWEISGATIIWAPDARSNIAAVSEPRPVGRCVDYYRVNISSPDFDEACANAEFIVAACNSYTANQREIAALRDDVERLARAENEREKEIAGLREAIEAEAARKAIASGLGVSEWAAFLWPEASAVLGKDFTK